MGGLHGLGYKGTDKVTEPTASHYAHLIQCLLLAEWSCSLNCQHHTEDVPCPVGRGEVSKVKVYALMGTQSERNHGPFLSSVSVVQNWPLESSYHLKGTTMEGRWRLIAPFVFVS